MPKTFGQHFDSVAEGHYGLRSRELAPYLSGEYLGGEKPTDTGEFELEIIWDRQNAGQIAQFTRTTILPESLELYAADNETDIRLLQDARVIGNVAVTSRMLTGGAILHIIEERLELREFKPAPLAVAE